MGCVSGSDRCTRCCQAIHVTKKVELLFRDKSRCSYKDQELLRSIWIRISKRRAKKCNPYMFQSDWDSNAKQWINQKVIFFKCRKVTPDGCGVYEQRPETCRVFAGGGMYRHNCDDYGVIATDA